MVGFVHVRDCLAAPDGTPVHAVMRPVSALPEDAPMAQALHLIRDERSHLIVVLREHAPVAVLTRRTCCCGGPTRRLR